MEPSGKTTFFNRQRFHQELLRAPPSRCCNDEIWTFNSQGGSQWDGLRHYAYQKERRFYNGVTMDDIHNPGADGQKTTQNGIQAFADHGIVGRGVLLDYHGWRQRQVTKAGVALLKPFNPLNPDAITLDQLLEVAKDQGTEIKFGDILIVRSGRNTSSTTFV